MRRLSPSKQDYLEVIWLLGGRGRGPVSASRIGERLGVKPPSVTRSVQALAGAGYLEHEPRGLVRMTDSGRAQAEMIHHIHQDLMQFLTDVLGVPEEVAETDAAQIEHCLSSATAGRLHRWLEMLEGLARSARPVLGETRPGADPFEDLEETPSAGWRA